MLFEEHHKWKVMTWLARSFPDFSSNLEMSEGSLVGIAGHVGSCNIRSFVSLLKSGMLREAKYDMWSGGEGLAPFMGCISSKSWVTQGGMHRTTGPRPWTMYRYILALWC
jgi:hypothetical protein